MIDECVAPYCESRKYNFKMFETIHIKIVYVSLVNNNNNNNNNYNNNNNNNLRIYKIE